MGHDFLDIQYMRPFWYLYKIFGVLRFRSPNTINGRIIDTLPTFEVFMHNTTYDALVLLLLLYCLLNFLHYLKGLFHRF